MNKNHKKNINRINVSNACDHCREKKIKCSGEKPKCKNCSKLNTPCVYNQKKKKRGPKNGYIEELVNKILQQQLERLIENKIISGKDIYNIVKKNNDIIISSEILKEHLNNVIIEEKNNNEQYFRYVYTYTPVISKETVIEHIQNKTILPELLLSIYGAAYLFKPNADIGNAWKYNKMALYFLMNYPHDSDVQTIQAYAIVSKSFSGTNLCWILFSYFIRKSNILNMINDNENLNKRCNLENKLTFLNVTSMDMILSIITGRSNRHDYCNILYSDKIINMINNANDNLHDLSKDLIDLFKIVIMDLVTSRLLAIVVHYINESHTDTSEIKYLENKIEYWFKLFEPIFICNDQYYSISYNNSIFYHVFFSTLKILYYRCKSTSIISNKIKIQSTGKDNFIMIDHIKDESDNLDNKYSETFLKYCYNLLSNKKFENDRIQKSLFNDDYGNNRIPIKTDFTNTINSSFKNNIPTNDSIIQNLDISLLNDNNNTNIKPWRDLTKVNEDPPEFEDKLNNYLILNLSKIVNNDDIHNKLYNINNESIEKGSIKYLNECYLVASRVTERMKMFRKEEYYEIAKFYENILREGSKYYIAVTPYSLKFREMMEEAVISVKNNSKKLTIKEIF
ncbi:hypothetical protein PIROE2DRAFT_8621 [Piromyces sp. E2]|nr:hypothetical protein PIROE2DRAFT_8621 [Piromyces sp. E2]|eukprot:OUM64549.1 hypothetical protein PIROE2DRAFT_8621 [Piromyces sp. E2]